MCLGMYHAQACAGESRAGESVHNNMNKLNYVKIREVSCGFHESARVNNFLRSSCSASTSCSYLRGKQATTNCIFENKH